MPASAVPAAPSDSREDRRGTLLVPFLAVAVAAAALHAPVLGWNLVGDDYEYARRAHEAAYRPVELLRPVGDLPRPLVVSTFLLDWTVWPRSARGTHLTTLILHIGAGLLLVSAARRLGLSVVAAAAVGLLWVCSPFAEECAGWASARADTLVLVGWLAAVLAWPPPGRPWTARGAVAAALGLAAAAAAKETWVGSVVLVAALEGTRVGWRSRTTLAWTGAVAALAAVYAGLRLGLAPPPDGYFRWAEAAGKLPRLLAAFLGLEELTPVAAEQGWRGALALVAAVLGLALAWRAGVRAALVGAALLAAGALPVLTIAYLPMRYAALPYAGFLLAAAALADRGLAALSPRVRRPAAAGALLAAAALLAGHALSVRRNQVDGTRLSEAHGRLLREAAAVADGLPVAAPVAVLRAESHNPLAEIAGRPAGRLRLLYVRRDAPHGLVDAGPLLDWVRSDRRTVVASHPDWRVRWRGVPGWILVHGEHGFGAPAEPVGDLAATAAAWEAAGGRLQVVSVEPLP